MTTCGALLLFTQLLAACAPDGTSASPRENAIRIGVPQGNFGSSDIGFEQFASIFRQESLAEADLNGRALPILAEGWNWEPSGLGLRIRLREDAFTHDGKPLTANLVVEALRAAVARPPNKELYWALSEINAIETTGTNELTISLNHAAGSLPEDLNVPLEFGPQKEGTGPYRLAKNTPEEIVLERFERYYRGQPTIAEVVIRPYSTLRTAWTSLLRGEIDMVTNVPPDVVNFLSNERIAVAPFPHVYQYVVAFNSKRGPLRLASVRRALNMAIDRKRLLNRVLDGHGLVATGPLWPQHWAIDGFVKADEFNPTAAESLLDSAGFERTSAGRSDGRRVRFSFTCLIPVNFSTEERLALEIQKNLYDIGVDVRFDALPPAEYVRRIYSGNFDSILTEMVGGPALTRPFIFWRSARSFKGLFNTFGYENAEAERLFAILRQSTNETVIRSAAQRLQEVFLDDPPALFLAWNEHAPAISRDFQVVQDPGRNPILALWRWKHDPGLEVRAAR